MATGRSNTSLAPSDPGFSVRPDAISDWHYLLASIPTTLVAPPYAEGTDIDTYTYNGVGVDTFLLNKTGTYTFRAHCIRWPQ